MKVLSLKDLPDELLPEPHELPGDLAEMAEEIGVRPTLALAERFRGTGVYFHNMDALTRAWRDRSMRKMYDTGQVTIKEVARIFGVSDRWAAEIIGRAEKDDRQMELFSENKIK